MKLPKFFQYKNGVTLIELIIVVAIISILATVAFVFTLQDRPGRTRDAKRKNDITEIAKALGFYLAVHESYPDEQSCDSSIGGVDSAFDEDCNSLADTGNWSDSSGGESDNILKGVIASEKILKVLPVDPIVAGTYMWHKRK